MFVYFNRKFASQAIINLIETTATKVRNYIETNYGEDKNN